MVIKFKNNKYYVIEELSKKVICRFNDKKDAKEYVRLMGLKNNKKQEKILQLQLESLAQVILENKFSKSSIKDKKEEKDLNILDNIEKQKSELITENKNEESSINKTKNIIEVDKKEAEKLIDELIISVKDKKVTENIIDQVHVYNEDKVTKEKENKSLDPDTKVKENRTVLEELNELFSPVELEEVKDEDIHFSLDGIDDSLIDNFKENIDANSETTLEGFIDIDDSNNIAKENTQEIFEDSFKNETANINDQYKKIDIYGAIDNIVDDLNKKQKKVKEKKVKEKKIKEKKVKEKKSKEKKFRDNKINMTDETGQKTIDSNINFVDFVETIENKVSVIDKNQHIDLEDALDLEKIFGSEEKKENSNDLKNDQVENNEEEIVSELKDDWDFEDNFIDKQLKHLEIKANEAIESDNKLKSNIANFHNAELNIQNGSVKKNIINTNIFNLTEEQIALFPKETQEKIRKKLQLLSQKTYDVKRKNETLINNGH